MATKPSAYVEEDTVAPINVYGQTKADGEQAVRDATPRHVIIRTSWVYGEFGQNFLKTMIELAATRDELRVVADQRGCPTSTPDLANAIAGHRAATARRQGHLGHYHFAGAGVTTWHGFARRIVAAQAPLTGRTPRVTPITTAEFPRPARRPVEFRTRLRPDRARVRRARPTVDRRDRCDHPRGRRSEAGEGIACRVRGSFSPAAPARGCIR